MSDAAGFEALFAREGERLLVFLSRRTLDVTVAGDLMAETFALALCAWRRLDGRAEEEQRAWLFTVAQRQVARYFRTARIERRAVQRLGLQVPQISEDDVAIVESRAGLVALRSTLRSELERLSVEQREALRLRVVEERSYPEVARLLGISEQAARARVSRGLRTLAKTLEPYRPECEATR